MKKIFLVFAFMALSILFITSCSKDDDNNNSSSTNSYTYNGEISEIKFAGIVDHTVGYEITLSPTVVPDCFDYNSDFFHLILPIEKLGLKCNLNEDNRGGKLLKGSYTGVFKDASTCGK